MKHARLVVLALTFVASIATAARAQDGGVPMPSPLCPTGVVGCDVRDLDWMWEAALFDAIDLDTGWVPAGSPIQLHFAFHLAGMTDIAMGGTAITSWPSPLTVGFAGRARTGTLSVDYGYELTAQMRFSLDVAGAHYEWMGDIPLPSTFPRSISLMGTSTFDPFVLPMAPTARPVLLTTSTARVPVFSYDALGGFVSVPGVGGGIAVDLEGAMTASYESDRIVVAHAADITREGGTTHMLPATGSDYGPSQDVVAHPEGTLGYDGTLLVYPNFYLSIAGRRFDYDLATIPIPIAGVSSNVVFTDQTAHVPLPDVVGVPTSLDFGGVALGATHVELLDVRNDGEAALVVHARPLGGDFATGADSLTVAPRATERLELDFTPSVAGPIAETLFLETNDPDHPLLVIALRGEGIAPPPPPDMEIPPPPDAGPPATDAGPPHAVSMGGCCRVAPRAHDGDAPIALIGVTLSLATLRNRKRRR